MSKISEHVSPCYVCGNQVELEDKYCHKPFDGVIKFRHLWHGTPSAVRATGGGGGFVGYAHTLEQAMQRSEYYASNAYAAPEVKAEEQEVLDEVIRLLAEQSSPD